MSFEEVVAFHKRYVEPFIAVIVLLMLIVVGTIGYKDLKMNTEIAQNCGWEKEDVRCFCEKSDVISRENEVKQLMGEFDYNVDR